MKRIILGITLSLVLLLTGSCSKEQVINKDAGEVPLSLLFPTSRGTGDDPEYVMDELRVIIFRSSASGGTEYGIPVLNKKYFPDAEFYEIRESVPVGYLNIYIIANERAADMGILNSITSSAQLQPILLNYSVAANDYLNSPFLMYEEFLGANINAEGILTHSKVKVAGGVTYLEIERAIAKITVTVDCIYADIPGGTEIALTGARVVNMPLQPWLVSNKTYTGSTAVDYFNSHLATSPLDISSDYFTSMAGDVGFRSKTDKYIEFYLPEHIIGVSNRRYFTYLELTGNTVSPFPLLSLTYKIPLGDGLGTAPYLVDYLLENYNTVPGSVLTITRNTNYIISIHLKGLGSRDAVEVIVKAKKWNPTIELPTTFENV